MSIKEHKCSNCPNRKKYVQNPKLIVGRLWRWHIKFCPGWKSYMASLNDAERNEIKKIYNLK